MKSAEERTREFYANEVTSMLPKHQIQRLYDVFKRAYQEFETHEYDHLQEIVQSLEDSGILKYLEWVFSENNQNA